MHYSLLFYIIVDCDVSIYIDIDIYIYMGHIEIIQEFLES